MTIDDVRARYPALAGAVYFYDPGQPVTLEILTSSGESFSFTAPTVADCIGKAFPELIQPECPNTGLPCVPGCDQKNCAGMHTPLNEWPEPTEPEPEEPAASVFD